jgi:hydroxymethylbilane synthase
MLRGEAHMAVHSLKDVPTVMPEGLPLAAITEREDSRDALLSEKYSSLDALPEGAVVGTSSLRRKMQLLMVRPDLEIKDLRGNVDTRIRKLKEGQFDAIILAAAGINRLGLLDAVAHISPIMQSQMISSMGQGALGLQTIEEKEVFDLVHQLNHKETEMEVTVERDFVDILEGGCHVPIGVNAKVTGDGEITAQCSLGLPNAKEIIAEKLVGREADYKQLGKDLAQIVIDKGAKELLARADQMD